LDLHVAIQFYWHGYVMFFDVHINYLCS
jgi:hypothetical protein